MSSPEHMLKGRIKSPSHNVVPKMLSQIFQRIIIKSAVTVHRCLSILGYFPCFRTLLCRRRLFSASRCSTARMAWHGVVLFGLWLEGESERGRYAWTRTWLARACLVDTSLPAMHWLWIRHWRNDRYYWRLSPSLCFRDVRPQRMNTLVVILCQFCRRLSVQCMCLPSRLPPKPPNAQDSIFSLRRHLRLA